SNGTDLQLGIRFEARHGQLGRARGGARCRQVTPPLNLLVRGGGGVPSGDPAARKTGGISRCVTSDRQPACGIAMARAYDYHKDNEGHSADEPGADVEAVLGGVCVPAGKLCSLVYGEKKCFFSGEDVLSPLQVASNAVKLMPALVTISRLLNLEEEKLGVGRSGPLRRLTEDKFLETAPSKLSAGTGFQLTENEDLKEALGVLVKRIRLGGPSKMFFNAAIK
ncbi:hypothetical protein MAR_027872, partial [Mya arenaria]